MVHEMLQLFFEDRAIVHALETGHATEAGSNFWICLKGCAPAAACAGRQRRMKK